MKTDRMSLFLMANLGSEVSQIFSYMEKGELKMAQSARSRANVIIAELLAHPDMKDRTGEVEILSEIIEDVFASSRHFEVKKSEIEAYFMPFAMRLMSV